MYRNSIFTPHHTPSQHNQPSFTHPILSFLLPYQASVKRPLHPKNPIKEHLHKVIIIHTYLTKLSTLIVSRRWIYVSKSIAEFSINYVRR